MSAAVVTVAEASELAGLYTARATLERSRDLGEIKQIRDVALAAKRYAEAKRLGTEMIGYAQEIANRAERRLGQILAETPSEQGRRSDQLGAAAVPSPRQQAGKKLAARAQQLAELSDDDFEKLVSKPTARLARIARDRRAEQRRIRIARQARNVEDILDRPLRQVVTPVTLTERLTHAAQSVGGPMIDGDWRHGTLYAQGWRRPYALQILAEIEPHVPELAADARREIEAAIAAYEARLTEAADCARADAERIAGMIRAAADQAPDVVVGERRSWTNR